ncbi:MAG: flagellar hook-basal body complex protein FliE [Bacteroidetes bacterium]|jgi:flagellar hook-basal body complex protein FliE|nr:flagellar hook-basal body complex protein FliE [Bacteroidota bacterium]
MNISQLQRVQQAPPGPERQLPAPQFDDQDDTPSFTKTLANAIDSVDGAQKLADQNIEAFVAGETENLHEVMISMNQAKLHFQLMTEVRNRSLETYQELMRMQV